MKLASIACARPAALALAGIFSGGGNEHRRHKQFEWSQGLAVAPNGNLYVANTNGNNVLLYLPSHAQLAAKTMSNQILDPTAVAFDSSGNLAIANAGNNTFVEYTPAGNPSTVITDRISQPFAIAFDALDDLWVNNGYSNLTISTRTGLRRPLYSSTTTSISSPVLAPTRHLLCLVEI